MSLGTNDDPHAVGTFRSAVRSTIHLARPPSLRGLAQHRAPASGRGELRRHNQVLAQENRRHRNMRVVKWTRIVSDHSLSLSTDGVHPTADGYKVRARAIAREVRSCAGRRAGH
jgi:lysophospholipase L1-like esterase